MTNDPDPVERFNHCVDSCADALYRVAFRLTGDAADAGELVQETYLNAWRSLDSLRDPERMKSWMFSVLRFQYTKWLRRQKQTVPTSSSVESMALAESVIAETTSASHLVDPTDGIQRALLLLPETHKLPLLLVAMEGLTVDQAAEVLQLPRGTVLSRLHRGRAKLKEILLQHRIQTESTE